VFIGGFNEVLSMTEKCGGDSRQEHLIKDFKETLDDCALTDLGYLVQSSLGVIVKKGMHS
jgi:hypothetical protein